MSLIYIFSISPTVSHQLVTLDVSDFLIIFLILLKFRVALLYIQIHTEMNMVCLQLLNVVSWESFIKM